MNEKWISVKDAQKLLRSPNTGKQPDRAVIRRWALTGRLTMRWIRYGSRSYIEVLEHEVRALCRTEGRIERRLRHAERVEELTRAEQSARSHAEARERLARLGIT